MTPILDHDRLTALAHASGVTNAAMLARFLRLNAADAVLLRQAVVDGDFARVGFFAHRMIGASLMLGAGRLALAGSVLSEASRTCDAQALRAAVDSLEKEIATLARELGAS